MYIKLRKAEMYVRPSGKTSMSKDSDSEKNPKVTCQAKAQRRPDR